MKLLPFVLMLLAIEWISSRLTKNKTRQIGDMTSPDGSADPGALSARARLSGSPSARRHTKRSRMLAQAGGTDAGKGGSVFGARCQYHVFCGGCHSLFEGRSCSYSASLDDDRDSGGRAS